MLAANFSCPASDAGLTLAADVHHPLPGQAPAADLVASFFSSVADLGGRSAITIPAPPSAAGIVMTAGLARRRRR